MFNKTQVGKFIIIFVGILMIALGVLSLIGGINLLGHTDVSWVNIVFGVLLCILFLVLLIGGIVIAWIGASLKATKGNLAEENMPKDAGIVNAVLCPKCGTKVEEGEFCPKCGKSVMKKIRCPECNKLNFVNNEVCVHCGTKLK